MDSLRSAVIFILDPVVSVFEVYHVSANTLTTLSLVFAFLAGVGYYFSSGNSLALFIALILVLLNSLLDSADGVLARKTGSMSKYGDFLDHVIDRYADVFIIGGACLGGYVSPTVGIMILTGVLLASYLGTQAQAVGIGRVYGGIMGRADRLVIMMLATAVNIVYMPAFGLAGYTYSILGWALVVIGIASHITALQRIWHVRKILIGAKEKF